MSDVSGGDRPTPADGDYVPRRMRPDSADPQRGPRPAGDDRPRRPRVEGDDRPRRPRVEGDDRPRRPRVEGDDRPRRPRAGPDGQPIEPRRPRPEGPRTEGERRPRPADDGRPRRPRPEGAAPPARRADESADGARPRRPRPPDDAPVRRARREGADPWRGQPVGADWTSDEWTAAAPVAKPDALPDGSWAGQSAWTASDAWEPGGSAVAGTWTGWDRESGPAAAASGASSNGESGRVAVIDTDDEIDDDLEVVDDEWDGDDWDDEDGWDLPGQYVRLPRRGGWAIRVGILLLVLLVGAVAVLLWAMRWVDREVNPSDGPGAEVEFLIEDAWSTNRIAEELATTDVIGNSTIFRYYLRCPSGLSIVLGCDEPITDSFQAGEYLMNENLGYDDVISRLRAGPIPPEFVSINVPEGLTLAGGQIQGKLVDENGQFSLEDIQAALNGGTIRSTFGAPEAFGVQILEGLLFPASYDIDEESLTDEAEFLARMATEMQNRYADIQSEVGRDPVVDELGLTDYQILIVASMIEEEGRIDGDRPRIARVIYNRLVAGEPLGIDATARYADFDPADREFDSPYNTRLYAGLPPTPIASPGAASIRAALAPEPGPWFYYVLTNEGGVEGAHRFVETAGEFEEAKQVCIDLDLGCG